MASGGLCGHGGVRVEALWGRVLWREGIRDGGMARGVGALRGEHAAKACGSLGTIEAAEMGRDSDRGIWRCFMKAMAEHTEQ